MKDMARPIHVDEDRLRLTWREIAGMVVGGTVFVGLVWLFLFLLFVVGQA